MKALRRKADEQWAAPESGSVVNRPIMTDDEDWEIYLTFFVYKPTETSFDGNAYELVDVEVTVKEPEPKERETGWYRVCRSGEWVFGKYVSDTKLWYIPEHIYRVADYDLLEINETRIDPKP